jgi:tricarballylate dehydrogenase
VSRGCSGALEVGAAAGLERTVRSRLAIRIETGQSEAAQQREWRCFVISDAGSAMTSNQQPDFDVIVVGSGNAGLCAAVSAAEAGANTLLLEKAPKEWRGGNTRQTSNYSYSFEGVHTLDSMCPGAAAELDGAMLVTSYSPEELLGDILRKSGPETDVELMSILAEMSQPTMRWLTEHGIAWEINWPMARRVGGRMAWDSPGTVLRPEGGGQAVVDALIGVLGRHGANAYVAYESQVVGLLTDSDGIVSGVRIRSPAGEEEVTATAVILAAAGFEANPQERVAHLGDSWEGVKVRGSRYNTGDGLALLAELGADMAGSWDNCHSSMVRQQASKFELDNAEVFPFAFAHSILVNRAGLRFVDEGESFLYETYSRVSKAALAQPGGIIFEVYDAKTADMRASKGAQSTAYQYSVGRADTLAEAAAQAGIDAGQFVATVEDYNAAVIDGVDYEPGRLDGRRTKGLAIDKSNWALRLDTPPFEIFALEVGITFTYGGVRADQHGRVTADGQPIPGLYAVGEMVGTFYKDYVAGVGMTKGAVFGRIAGAHAAEQVTASRN